FLTAAIEAVAEHKEALRKAVADDINRKSAKISLSFKSPAETSDSLILKGIASKRILSELTNDSIVQWLGEPETQRVAIVEYNIPDMTVQRPKGYWVPSTYPDVIHKLQQHGIAMEVISEPRTVA